MPRQTLQNAALGQTYKDLPCRRRDRGESAAQSAPRPSHRQTPDREPTNDVVGEYGGEAAEPEPDSLIRSDIYLNTMAVDGVSCEPVSGLVFPDNPRNTGILLYLSSSR